MPDPSSSAPGRALEIESIERRGVRRNVDARAALVFVANLRRLHRAGETDRALDLVFSWVDQQLKSGDPGAGACDLALCAIDVSTFDEDILVGLLASTSSGKSVLHERGQFADRVERRLADEIGASDARKLVAELT
jgi:hypothetical protein